MSGWTETPEERLMRLKRWRTAVGVWLRDYEWNHWVTLTVARRWPPDRLGKAFVEEFVRYATKVSQGPVAYSFVIEGGAVGDQAHLHCLLHGTASIPVARLETAWRHGRASAEVYDRQRGAAYYMAKEIGGRVLDYDCSHRMPPHTDALSNTGSGGVPSWILAGGTAQGSYVPISDFGL